MLYKLLCCVADVISTAIESQRKQHNTRGIDAGTYVASVAVKALQQRTAALRYIHIDVCVAVRCADAWASTTRRVLPPSTCPPARPGLTRRWAIGPWRARGLWPTPSVNVFKSPGPEWGAAVVLSGCYLI